MVRDFEKAVGLFLEALATFSAGEILRFKDFIELVILLSMAASDRSVIGMKVGCILV